MSPIRFIAGSGRSGTTWILDALASANRLRPVFEPLHPYVSEVGRRYAHRALSADEEHPELKEFLLGVCEGRGPRLWTQYRQQRRWLIPPADEFWSKKDAGRTMRNWSKFLRDAPRLTAHAVRREPLVKCIRANLMLPWIASHLASRIVLILRHPGAVIESELRGNWNPAFTLDRFKNDKRLQDLTQGRYQALLGARLNHVEALTLRWVIENQWVIEEACKRRLAVFHYERLRDCSCDEWSSLCLALDVEQKPDSTILKKPSQQSSARNEVISMEQADLPRWMGSLSRDQAKQIQGILDAVELDWYSMDTANPVVVHSQTTQDYI